MRSIAPGIVGNLSGGDMADAGNNRAGRMRGALGGSREAAGRRRDIQMM